MKKIFIILSLTTLVLFSCNDVNSAATDDSGTQNEIHEIKLTETGTSSFGSSVSVSDDGTTVAVGDQYYNSKKGAVFIYRKTSGTWALAKKLTASDASSGGTYVYFGCSISLSADGSVILIGASSDDSKDSESGSAYLYSGTDWGTETKLTAGDGKASDHFGTSVSLSDDGSIALVGAYNGDSASETDCGAAYVYSGTDWGTETELTQPTSTLSVFGNIVSLSANGSVALITDHGKNRAYVYSGTNYTSRVDLAPTLTDDTQDFGYAAKISSDGKKAVIGAHYYQYGAGIIYAYSGDWAVPPKIIQASNKASYSSYSNFGRVLGMSGDGSIIMSSRYLNSPYCRYSYSGSDWGTETIVENTPKYVSFDLSEDGSVVICGLSNSAWLYY